MSQLRLLLLNLSCEQIQQFVNENLCTKFKISVVCRSVFIPIHCLPEHYNRWDECHPSEQRI